MKTLGLHQLSWQLKVILGSTTQALSSWSHWGINSTGAFLSVAATPIYLTPQQQLEVLGVLAPKPGAGAWDRMEWENLGCRGFAQPDGPKEGGVLAHIDRDVGVHHLHGNFLPGLEEAHACSIASVVVGLSCLNAAGALQEGLLIHHHLVAGKVSEVDVVHLGERQREGIGGERKKRVGALPC